MSGLLNYEGLKISNGEAKKVSDPITIEKALQISINDSSFSVVMQTPGSELELGIGLLYSEDILKPKFDYSYSFEKDEDDTINIVNFIINKSNLGQGYLSSRSLLSVSSCGICGKQSLDDINVTGDSLPSTTKISPNFIFDLQSKMHAAQIIFPKTGSIHGAALFNSDGDILSCQEDIGRHNALDKAVGELILNRNLNQAEILFFSGRISYEIVIKAFRAKIKTIIAISGPSSLAIDYAKEFGINIIGFCRENRMTAYTNTEFIEI